MRRVPHSGTGGQPRGCGVRHDVAGGLIRAQTHADSPAMRLSLALFALVLAGAACAPAPEENAPGVTLTERSTFRVDLAGVGDLRRGTNQFVVRAWDTSGSPAALTRVMARMPSHPHESSEAMPTPAGEAWRVDDLRLPMAGRWVVTLRFERGTASDEARIDGWVP